MKQIIYAITGLAWLWGFFVGVFIGGKLGLNGEASMLLGFVGSAIAWHIPGWWLTRR